MKYSINRIQYNTLSQQVWWLDDKCVCLHPRGEGSNFTNGVFVVNNSKLTKYFLM